MAYTEIKEVNGKKYYYRVLSIRAGDKINKKRIYLGANVDKEKLKQKEIEADKELVNLNGLLTETQIALLAKIKKDYSKEPKSNLENRYEAFCSLFTYNSTAIEGNTLTLQQTSQLLFENITPGSKSLREINEILNHKIGFDLLLDYEGDITKSLILKLHQIVVQNTLKEELQSQIGKYRNVQVYIRGADWVPPKPKDVPLEMKSLLSWYSKNKTKLHPIILAAYFHIGFEGIHPFIDGNGRVGRLLMNFILHKNKYPMINIPNTSKSKYYETLQIGQIKDNLKPFVDFLIDLLIKEKIKF